MLDDLGRRQRRNGVAGAPNCCSLLAVLRSCRYGPSETISESGMPSLSRGVTRRSRIDSNERDCDEPST